MVVDLILLIFFQFLKTVTAGQSKQDIKSSIAWTRQTGQDSQDGKIGTYKLLLGKPTEYSFHLLNRSIKPHPGQEIRDRKNRNILAMCISCSQL
jgi:hypothetical protein